MHFVTKLRPYFWNFHKITNFLKPIKSYFKKKIWTLFSGFGPIFFSHKNKSRAETTQNNEKRFFYILVLDSQPESILGEQDADSKITQPYCI